MAGNREVLRMYLGTVRGLSWGHTSVHGACCDSMLLMFSCYDQSSQHCTGARAEPDTHVRQPDIGVSTHSQ